MKWTSNCLVCGILFLIFLFGKFSIHAQTLDTLDSNSGIGADILENIVQNLEADADFNFNDLAEQLQVYMERPLDLNKASSADLQSLQFLTDGQISNFITYRSEFGNLMELEELQAIPSFDLQTIDYLLPFVTLKSSTQYLPSVRDLLTNSRNDLMIRWGRNLEELAGFTDEVSEGSRFQGDPNNLYVRFRKSYGRRFSVGVTAEKDAGETFFKEDNKQGFDFYSAHLAFTEVTPWLKSVHIGDYSVSLGQGLIQFNGFGYGKSAAVTQVRRQSWAVRPYTSRGEQGFFRGAAIELTPLDKIEILAFGSNRKQDGNQVAEVADTSDLFNETLNISSLQVSGLHRTINEIADEDAIDLTTIGGRIKWGDDRMHISANGVYDRLSTPLIRGNQQYNLFRFSGDEHTNVSLDYGFLWRNVNFFGETGWSDFNNALATVNGAIVTLDRRTEMAVVYRHFPIDFEAIHGAPFAERAITNNETGLYAGLLHRFSRKWSWAVYADGFKHPWMRFGVDGPSKGWEGWTRLTYTVRRKGELYVQFRQIDKEENGYAENNFNQLVGISRQQLRLHGSWNPIKGLTLRQRWEFSRFSEGGQPVSKGWMIYQDVIVKPLGSPLSGNIRLILFDTDDYDSRVYSFENSLIYDPLIPAYFDRGFRYYLNLRYKGIRNLTLEGRIAQTYKVDGNVIGSGSTASLGPQKTDVRFQIRWSF